MYQYIWSRSMKEGYPELNGNTFDVSSLWNLLVGLDYKTEIPEGFSFGIID